MRHLARAAFGAALLFAAASPAAAQGGDPAVAACVDQILQKVPSWGAMKKFRDQMRQSGYNVNASTRESDPKTNRSWTAYNVQIRGDRQAYRIACEDRR